MAEEEEDQLADLIGFLGDKREAGPRRAPSVTPPSRRPRTVRS